MRLTVILLVTACGGGDGGTTDIEGTLRFADRTDPEISRLVSAASGSEGFEAQASLYTLGNSSGVACPAATIAGDTVTLTGRCTTEDGVAVEGRAEITNPIAWGEIAYDARSASTYVFDDFALTQAGTRHAYDGVYVVGAGYGELDMNLTTDASGTVVRTDLFMECSASSCAISGSGIELVGVGGALVSGSVTTNGQTTSATYTLKGQDTVQVTMQNNCVSWVLEGTDRLSAGCPSP